MNYLIKSNDPFSLQELLGHGRAHGRNNLLAVDAQVEQVQPIWGWEERGRSRERFGRHTWTPSGQNGWATDSQ